MKDFFRVFILSIGVYVIFILFYLFKPSLVAIAIGIGVVCLAAVLFFVLLIAFGGDNTKYLKDKFGDNYQDLINTGKLNAYTAAPCRPAEQYTNHDILCKEINIALPEYDIVSCEGTLSNFNGDYHETVEIKFRTPLTPEIKKQLLSFNNGENHYHPDSLYCNIRRPFQGPNSTDDLFWSLEIIDDYNGIINYGRV